MPTQGHRELLAWLEARLDSSAQEAADLIFAQIPRYRAAADDQLYVDVVAHCRNVMQILLRAQREDREPNAADYDWTSAQAVRRVSVGLEVTDFLRGFRLAQLTTWNHVQAAVAEHPDWIPAALDMVDPIMRVYEMGSKVAAVAWLEAQRWQVAGEERVHADLMDDLLAGRVPTVPARRRVLAECGIDGERFEVAVVSVADEGRLPDSLDALSEVCRELVVAIGGLVVARGDEVYAVFPAGRDGAALVSDLEQAVRRLRGRGIAIRVGLSFGYASLADVPTAATEAARARELAGPPGVLRLGDLTLLDYVVAQADSTALQVIDRRIREVLAEDLQGTGQFADTLEAYVQGNLNAKVAAQTLTVHANTVYYRLERFGERTGRDLRRIDHLFDALLALRLMRRWADAGEPLD